ncbi:ribonuclease P protein component [Lichenihabitans sp. Uapishka_5]|uniref:ribonuclease P protein component n=1 Tax=Lichenihabitans sp. Uapishka_5 TaxID=3037302 RepID=UPI0029E81EB4|nr:ribonuclease P protein component [Lichenihabitans sp. Uapishka_5]MDX7950672.1 ribonuclease P protein component [Lichenihabitans sp. Uapishka_5]
MDHAGSSDGPSREPPLRLKKRSEFLHVAGGRKSHSALFTIQARLQAEPAASRVGLTVTKKVGNAVERNRIKRRLRDVLRRDGGISFQPGHDYVVVARRPLLDAAFSDIGTGFRLTAAKAHAKPGGGRTNDRNRTRP